MNEKGIAYYERLLVAVAEARVSKFHEFGGFFGRSAAPGNPGVSEVQNSCFISQNREKINKSTRGAGESCLAKTQSIG